MSSVTPKVTSRGRWQPTLRAKAAPPPQPADLKDYDAPATSGRLRPYLFAAAASLPLVAGLLLWQWTDVPSPQVGTAGHGIAQPIDRSLTVEQAQVALSPDGATFFVEVTDSQPSRGELGFRYQWFVNGQPVVGQSQSTLPRALTKREDRVFVELMPTNGHLDGTLYRTPDYVVANAPPHVLKLTIEPQAPRVGEHIRVLVETSDQDGDEARVTLRWSRNGILVQDGPSVTYAGDPLVRGDRLAVEAIPRDDYADGPNKIEEVTIANGIPKFTSSPQFVADGGSLSYTVKATDPDKDRLTFTLTTAPPGMMIDKASGRITWKPATGTKGSQRVRVEVKDEQDGVATQAFDVTVPAANAS